jgi:hypothetical protein
MSELTAYQVRVAKGIAVIAMSVVAGMNAQIARTTPEHQWEGPGFNAFMGTWIMLIASLALVLVPERKEEEEQKSAG